MTTHTLRLCTCSKPTREDSYMCADCKDALWRALGNVPALVDELEVSLTKQTRFTTQTSSARVSTAPPLPYDPAASRTLDTLHTQLTKLTQLCIKRNIESRDYQQRTPGETSVSMSAWLMWRVDALAAQPDIDSAQQLVRVVQKAEYVIDRPPERTYAGPCDDCGRDLYAEHSKQTVICHHCGISYDLAARRQWLLRVVNDRLATATEIARALTSLELPVTAERIRQWKHRERIDVVSHDRLGRPLFRVGDIVELLHEHTHQRGA